MEQVAASIANREPNASSRTRHRRTRIALLGGLALALGAGVAFGAGISPGSFGTSLVGVTSSSGETLPNGRWVLLDADGRAVEAVVAPSCRALSDECPAFAPPNPTCVWIEYLGQASVGEAFRLDSGRPEGCHDGSGLDRQRWQAPPAWLEGALDNPPYELLLVYGDG